MVLLSFLLLLFLDPLIGRRHSSSSSSSFFCHDPSTARSNVGMKSERRPETGPDSPHHLCILACISQPPPPFRRNSFLACSTIAFPPRECPDISTFPRPNVTRVCFPASLLSSLRLVNKYHWICTYSWLFRVRAIPSSTLLSLHERMMSLDYISGSIRRRTERDVYRCKIDDKLYRSVVCMSWSRE